MRLKKSLKKIIHENAIGRFYYMPHRLSLALSYYKAPLTNLAKWTLKSREHTNFTYHLDPLNQAYLASFVSVVTRETLLNIEKYIAEVLNDNILRAHIETHLKTSKSKALADHDARYGRRLGWYALIRCLKPRVVIETGVDKGLGSCIIAAALMKNTEEGYPGIGYGTDIIPFPQAGYLIQAPYDRYFKLLTGDSIESLKKISEPIDIFINDSDHSAAYEFLEYKEIENKLAENAIILGDNSHVTDKLFLFAQETKRSFLFFAEKPQDHWYPGAGIGIAFKTN